jgi:hypothetical protein
LAADRLPEQDWRLSDPRHDAELWRLTYDCNPDLERVSNDALDKRYAEILNNVLHLVRELRDMLPESAHFLSSWWWLKVKFQTEREYARRKRGLPEILNPPSAPDWKIPFSPLSPNDSNLIIKYGEASWLEPMLKSGAIRISPASKYKGEVPETDVARHDDELNKHRYSSGGGATATLLRTGQTIPIIGGIRHTVSAPNYYVLCCSNEFDYRLFSAFKNSKGEEEDTCLVIRDVDEFARRLEVAVHSRLPGWHYFWASVLYYDPYNPVPNQRISPGIYKDFKYAYQREYRFLWHPLSHRGASEFFYVKIGSLEDIAELHRYPK